MSKTVVHGVCWHLEKP